MISRITFAIGACLFTFQSFSQISIQQIGKVFRLAEEQYGMMVKTYPDSTKFPKSNNEDGSIRLSPSHEWTSGFFGGSLWFLYEYTKKEFWKKNAIKWTESLDEIKKRNSSHDLGFMVFIPYGNGYKSIKDLKYKEVALEAAYTLSRRFDSKVGAIRSWDFKPYSYPVIVDNLMNLELLLWAFRQSGDSTFYNIVTSHAAVDLKHRFRSDNSTFHVLDFDPATGNLLAKKTHQGFADSSCWSRGQAWAIYGYTMLYRELKDEKYLHQAEKSADYFIKEVSEISDKIPYWDFDDSKIPNTWRDASAAAIAASALIELSAFSKNKKYLSTAGEILNSLSSSKYLATSGSNNYFLLKHSTGNKPANSEIDVPIIYADYYFLEALLRMKKNLKNNSFEHN